MRKSQVSYKDLESFIRKTFYHFPWEMQITYLGNSFSIGKKKSHWCNEPLRINIKTNSAARTIIKEDSLGFLIKAVEGEIGLSGNIYVLTFLRNHGKFDGIKSWRWIKRLVIDNTFQSRNKAKVNVKSHYDMPEIAISKYLDSKYESYSTAIWKDPFHFDKEELTRIGNGEADNFDSLEKAQWRKFKDGMNFINPKPGDKIIDIGCGYGGQLKVGLEEHPKIKFVGWTHSHNQVVGGNKLLDKFPRENWELHEGDYREEKRSGYFDHVTSSGMVSHVGPKGLIPYVKNIRKLMNSEGGGKYVHHAIMDAGNDIPINWGPGSVFNKMFVWPGFHWFTPGQHLLALESNGFKVHKIICLNDHYSKTAAAWHLRFKKNKEEIRTHMNEEEYRAWEIYLAGAVGAFKRKFSGGKYRFYCESLPLNSQTGKFGPSADSPTSYY